MSAARAPLRSMIALVATVVPCTSCPISPALDPGLAQERRDARFDRQAVVARRRQEFLAEERALAREQDDVGERAADVDAEAVAAHPRPDREIGASVREAVKGQARRGACTIPPGCRNFTADPTMVVTVVTARPPR